LQKPPFELPSQHRERLDGVRCSLAWLNGIFRTAHHDGLSAVTPRSIATPTGRRYLYGLAAQHVRAAPVGDIEAASQRTCEQIRDLTMAQGVRFLDLRPALRAAAANELIHGPRDWNHRNDAGFACSARKGWCRRWMIRRAPRAAIGTHIPS